MTERHTHGGLSGSGLLIERPAGTVGARARAVERNSAEAKRRERAGIRSPGGRGVATLIWQAPPRNGLPEFVPYIYRGTGEDQYAHLYDEEELCG